jgi:secreted trypsin-like serine protease
MARIVFVAALLPTLALAAGATPADPLDERPDGQRVHRIVNGDVTDAWPATVALLWDEEAGCTGTLIEPTVVLTAAHCLEEGDPDTVLFGPALTGTVDRVGVGRAVMHPAYASTQGDEGDIGLVFLNSAAPVRPAVLDVQDAGRLQGKTITYVGFGETQGTGGEGRKKEATATVVEVGADILDVQPDSGSACYGDSGGGLYFRQDGVDRVVGVVSFGYTDDCMDLGGNTRTDKYLPWIGEQTGSAVGDSGTDGVADGADGADGPCTEAEWDARGEACWDREPVGGAGCAAPGAQAAWLLLALPMLRRRED